MSALTMLLSAASLLQCLLGAEGGVWGLWLSSLSVWSGVKSLL